MPLLEAWEEGAGQPSTARAIALLAAAWPERPAREWAMASIGERDRALLGLREELFGPLLEAAAACPACTERVQLTFTTRDILSPASAPPADLYVTAGAYDVKYRLPTSADLLEISACPGESALLRRCIETARKESEPVDPEALPREVIEAVAAGMAVADPQADVRIAVTCPACSHQWSSFFDIVSFLWGEIEDWAWRLLGEVHALASAYGWTERDIVELSPRRRRFYLEMVGAL